ncbi:MULTISPECIES: Hpt domain-containing protein [Pseudomonas]|uniref:Hpt domain-containing protein n=1 Tax=Pseudomonas donghuensis TaxID=1163398 RepID=A0AAP0SIE9_9PSED|nr:MULTISPECIES: Hpt domain-containing protein [Pseudomonas]MBS7600106.1 Hpt domain-containing protein [Pseudomonas sp. RC2C2]MDF9892455.1 HPt (histidine-containing phosphotransfer) domain-containing protein [Pseudomonas vranovensis]KDO01017.1 Hpt domain-containing protein [Pseudomonas donghuensis]MBF4207586.1 Hpt domain-containing protein [Pseudomonas donghuensis]MCP6692067.1 Hpt domain-containing protein [Pseudomonas donghuensis]
MSDIHIDRKVLSDLQEVMEDGYLYLLETFLDDSEKRLSQLHEAKNADELAHAAHSFKGSSSNMGALALAELCRQLEDRVNNGPLQGIEDLINQIDREYSAVRQLYREERRRVSIG